MDFLSPEILGLIVIALVIAGVIFVVIRRRRRAQSGDSAPPPDIGAPIDYTSMPYEEPTSLVDRFRSAPPAVKALVILVPVLLIGGLIALALTLTGPTGSAPRQADTPPPPPPELAITRAEVAGNGKIVVVGTTNLPDSATIRATLKEDGQEFAWANPDTAVSQPKDGKISITLDRTGSAPVPHRDHTYTVQLAVDGQQATSPEANVNVLAPYEADFYQTVAQQPTATPKPTEAPTPEQPAATEAPTEAPAAPTATVIGGGKIRKEPSVQAEEVGQITKGETLTLVERTPDGAWYRVQGAEGEGWVSSALLEVTPEVAAQVPTPQPASNLTTTVFNGGNVRPGPGLKFNPPVDQINAGESVSLLSKTADDQWFKITNVRGKTGWVNRTLLNLSVELSQQVPVEGSQAATPAGTPVPGLTAKVFNGGNVRPRPSVTANPALDQVNAGETVTLLARTADSKWYQVTTIRGVTGWVSVTLLTVDPDVARQVPVSK